MARKKIERIGNRYANWDEVDEAMRQLCVNERKMSGITDELNTRIDAEKKAADAACKPIQEETAKIEAGIQEYATEHREDMGKLKSRQLNFGTVYFRKSTKLRLPTAVEKVRAIIERLRARGMTDCISQPEPKILKDALKTYSPDIVIAVGASIDVDEAFSYELDQTKLQ